MNRRQARWSEKLADYHFNIVYRPGKHGGKPDALTRRSGDLPKEGDERLSSLNQAVLDPAKFIIAATFNSIQTSIRALQQTDKLLVSIHEALKTNKQRHATIPLAEVTIVDDCLRIFGLLLVPDNLELQRRIIESCHDHTAVGHPGRAKTFEVVSTDYWWPTMRKTIA